MRTAGEKKRDREAAELDSDEDLPATKKKTFHYKDPAAKTDASKSHREKKKKEKKRRKPETYDYSDDPDFNIDDDQE